MHPGQSSGKIFRSTLDPFDYFEPSTAGEAVAILGRYRGKARLLAGGTRLLVSMRKGDAAPQAIINIKKIRALQFEPKIQGRKITLSALTTLAGIAESGLLQKKVPALCEAAACLPSWQVRNLATLGGSLCGAGVDLAPALIALGAHALVKTPRRQWILPVEELPAGSGKAAVDAGLMLLQVRLTVPDRDERVIFRKLPGASFAGHSVLSTAVWIRRARKRIEGVRIAVGGPAIPPLCLKEAGRILKGTEGGDGEIAGAAYAAAAGCDAAAGAEMDAYTLETVRVLLTRTLKEILS
jgi:CO/xanthine dehydrogenase FAD-binding subunit